VGGNYDADEEDPREDTDSSIRSDWDDEALLFLGGRGNKQSISEQTKTRPVARLDNIWAVRSEFDEILLTFPFTLCSGDFSEQSRLKIEEVSAHQQSSPRPGREFCVGDRCFLERKLRPEKNFLILL
jgi:hypothetical protein